MLWQEIKNIESGEKELKKFGLTIGIFLILLGFLFFYLNKSYYLYFLSSGSLFAALGLALPKILLPFQKVWMSIAVILGFFMTRLILSVLFYIVFTPMSFIAKLVGKNFLDEKIEKNAKSYWHYRENKEYEKIETERQF